jgi:DNA-binding CsgD family transcriptional regulator
MDRVRALCAAALGREEEARAYFQSAYEFCRKAGYRPELAWTCYDWACFEKECAPRLLEEAASIASELGMKPLAARIQRQRPHQAPPRADGLTQREIEVVRLAAAGKANKEIADALRISYHTVVNHLKSIYRKAGVHSRAALATYAAHHGVTGPTDQRRDAL